MSGPREPAPAPPRVPPPTTHGAASRSPPTTRPMDPTRRVSERFGAVRLELETLVDLDRAVDALPDAPTDEVAARRLDLCPYFGVVWPSARAVALELAGRGDALAGRRVLELGCGLALPSLVAARLGARVTATDAHPDVGLFLERNLALNGLTRGSAAGQVDFRALDWNDGALGDDHDLVVGSDILYEARQPVPVARALAAHAAPGGEVLLADPGRRHLQRCVDELGAAGFEAQLDVVEVADPALDRDDVDLPPPDGPQTAEVFLLRLRRP